MAKTLPVILFLTFAVVGCIQNEAQVEQASSDYFDINEDKFGFLVFDKLKTDTFFARYAPLQINNKKLDSAFQSLMTDKPLAGNDETRFSKHTRPPLPADLDLAKNVLSAGTGKEGEKYFGASLNYLFFYECLPDGFQKKWMQSSLGDFQFNVTFFNRLRTRCKLFDDHIYGNAGYWDKHIKIAFQEEVYNEITADNARLIKDCISRDTSFNDKRMETDRENFIFFLDQVVEKKWRLFLIDNN